MKNYYSYTISCLILLCFFAPLYAVEKNRPGDVSLGVAVENGLVLVNFFDQLRKRGKSVYEAVFEACQLRVRPLMMTTLTTLMGLLPMLYATGSGSEIQQPLVAVIFGGLITSLALTLIILPVLYVLVNHDKSVTSAEVI